jgi:hypothetical protein
MEPAAAERRGGEATRAAWLVLALFLASRLALAAVGLLAQILIQPSSTFHNPLHLSAKPLLNLWGAWDSGWYHALATAGYDAHPQADGSANWVFFPAYPGLSALLARLTHLPVFLAMLVVSNLSFCGALFLIHRETRAAFDRRAADAVVVLFCAVPGSYIFSSAYTESLFLLAVAACLSLARQRRWLAAGGCAALAALTRNLGVGLVLPLAMMGLPALWRTARLARGRRAAAPGETAESVRILVALALPILALGGFMAYLAYRSADPLAFLHVEAAWGRSPGNPLAAPVAAILHPERLADRNLISFVACWLSLAMIAVLAAMRRWPLLLLACFLALAPLSTGLESYQRYALVNLPLFMAAAGLLSPRPVVLAGVVVAFATLNGFMMAAWALSLPLVT